MIKVEGLCFRYQEAGALVLQGLNLEIPAGQWLAIIGANGSGKSTLARHLNGLLLPESGRVLVEGFDTAKDDQLWQARQKVAFVFQNPDNQLVATSVEDDIAFGPENLGVPAPEIGQRLEEALTITGLREKRKKAPHLLSGGEKQRVAIAGALAMRSDYLVLDEPTSMLDPQLRSSVLATLKNLHQELGMGIIYVTNMMEEALLAQRVIVLGEGRFLKEGTPAEVFSDHQWLATQQLALPPICQIASMLAANGYPELAGSLSIEELLARLQQQGQAQKSALKAQPKAASKKAKTAKGPAPKGGPKENIISIKDLSYTYQQGSPQEVRALHKLDLQIKQGELAAIIGHSGSGKSTLAQLLTGLLAPDRGSLRVNGITAADLPKGGIFQGVGLVFQYPEQQLFAETVFEEVAFGAKNLGMPAEKLPQLVRKALSDVGLEPELFWRRSPFALSGGQKRRLCIAGVLAMGAQILIFDEPTAGLDAAGTAWILDLARRLNQQGKTILWISHNMEEVAELAGRIIVLSQGKLLYDGSPAQVFEQEQHLAQLGLDIPLSAKLVRQAKQQGLDIAGQAITVKEAYGELAAWLGGESRD